VIDPWAVPEEEDLPEGKEEGMGYRLIEPVEKPRPARAAYLDPEPDPYEVANSVDEPQVRACHIELEQSQIDREVELRTRKIDPPPAFPLFSGVYSFPAYQTTLKALVWLSCWGLFTGGLLRWVLSYAPF
jgi:hypothetical protein